MKKNHTKVFSFFIMLGFLYPVAVKAQIPIDCSKFYLHDFVSSTIYTYDISTSTFATNAIPVPFGAGGLAVSNNINSGTPAVTFYTTLGGQYYYYNGFSWINTGHNTSSLSAVNICGAGPFIYNIDGIGGAVYRYDGTGNDVLALNLTNWDGPYDVIGDDNGNFYVLYTNTGFQKLAKYSPTGSLLCTYSLVNMPNSSGGSGYAIVGNKLYVSGTAGDFVGTISGTAITFTGLTGIPTNIGDYASCPFPQLSSSISNPTNLTCTNLTTILTVTSTVTGPSYSWSGPGIVSGSGTSIVTVNQPGVYTVVITGSGGVCPGASTSTISVIQNGVTPVVSVSSSVVVTCVDSVVNLSVSPAGMNYVWIAPLGSSITSGVNSQNAIGLGGGTYTVIVTDPIGGCSATDVIMVAEDITPPSVSASGGGVLTCTTLNLILSGSSGSSVNYNWSGPGIVSGGNTANPVINLPGNYSLTVTSTINGCVSNIPAVLAVSQDTTIPSVSITTAAGNGTITCAVNPIVLNAIPSSGVSYSWSGPGIVSGGNTANPSVNQAGNYSITVTDNFNGCSNTLGSANSVINVPIDTLHPLAQINLATTGSISCTNTVAVIDGSASTTGSSITYSWSTNTGVISGNGSTNMPSVTGPGSYTLTVLNMMNGCSDTSSVNIFGNVSPPTGVDAGSNALLPCNQGSLNLSGISTSSNVSYTWIGPGNYSANTNIAAGVSSLGIYTLTVTDNMTGCTSSDTVSVMTQSVFASFTADQTGGIMPLFVNFTNSSTGAVIYNWSFGDGNTSAAINPSNTFLNSGIYNVVLIVYNNTGTCSDTAAVVITVLPNFTLIIPNVFTPNDDGINDEFYIKSTGVKELTCEIFNRWGEKVFTLIGPQQKWDGITSAGVKVTDGTYLYILKVVPFNGNPVEKQGSINIFR